MDILKTIEKTDPQRRKMSYEAYLEFAGESKIVEWRAVFDTNVIIAALKSKNPNSPNVELLQRWRRHEFTIADLPNEIKTTYQTLHQYMASRI